MWKDSMTQTLAITCGLIILSGLAGCNLSNGPMVTIDQALIHVGSAVKGETVRHEFRLVNSGDAPLEIIDIRAGCQCTRATVSSSTIAPGADGHIRVEVDTGALEEAGRNDRNVYALRKDIELITNVRDNANLVLSVLANVYSELVFVESGTIAYGDVIAGQEVVAKATIRKGIVGDAGVLKAISPDEDIVVTVLDRDGVTTIEARLLPTAAPGRHFGSIVVYTSSPIMQEMRIPVQAMVRLPR